MLVVENAQPGTDTIVPHQEKHRKNKLYRDAWNFWMHKKTQTKRPPFKSLTPSRNTLRKCCFEQTNLHSFRNIEQRLPSKSSLARSLSHLIFCLNTQLLQSWLKFLGGFWSSRKEQLQQFLARRSVILPLSSHGHVPWLVYPKEGVLLLTEHCVFEISQFKTLARICVQLRTKLAKIGLLLRWAFKESQVTESCYYLQVTDCGFN